MPSITDRIRYIGVDDDNLDLFEGQYPVPHGISYNSYVIEDEHIAIIDTADARRNAEWLSALDGALGDRKPSYLVVQHVEPDHSGSIHTLIDRYPGIKIVATAKAIEMLDNFFEKMDFRPRAITVTDGDTLTLGRSTLRFITAPMVHWPEVMMTLDETDGILFSADAFGSFATHTSLDAWDSEARRYYCNIVGKYGRSVQSVMNKLKGLEFTSIAPLHGPILSGNLARYWMLYDKWSRYEPESRGILVAYASIYGGTAEAARRLAGMLRENGAGDVVLMDLARHDVSYAVAQAFRLSGMALCCATYDAGLFTPMANFLQRIAAKGLCDRTVGLVENGSWAPIAGKLMADRLAAMKNMTIAGPTVTIRSRLHASDLPALASLAAALS